MPESSLLKHVLEIVTLKPQDLPEKARRMARLSLYDWMTVSLAGSREPLSKIIREFVIAEGGVPISTVTGTNMRLPARAAALANGTISHALDYDDTHFGYLGHPSVAIMPAALAVAEEVNATANEMLDAFLYGAECACRVGMVLGRDHYDAGFHQTATSGAFGATIAASKLRNLDLEVISTAIGLVSSRASGLKSQFGTMGKPFNAGTAAANGVEAATLAGLGFTASGDAFAGPQSFLVTHNSSEDRQKKLLNWPLDEFFFSSVSHKLYACCHGTHAMIEALLEFVEGGSLTEDNFEMIEVYVGSRWLNVCDIKKPRTGLQIKFSYVFLAAMVLKQENLSAYETFVDVACNDQGLLASAKKIKIIGDDQVADSAVRIAIRMKDGTEQENSFDLLEPLDPVLLSERLKRKARSLIGYERADELWNLVNGLDNLSAAQIADFLKT